MTEETTRPVPTYIGADGIPFAHTVFSPVECTIRAACTVPPWTVVPVIFVPGIMGSNLKAKKDVRLGREKIFSKGERVWNVDSDTSPMNLLLKGPAFRQAIFDKGAVEVDNSGKIAGVPAKLGVMAQASTDGVIEVTPQSHLLVKEAKKRGWGTASYLTYGKFLDWLQYQLSDGRLVEGKPNAVFERVAKLAGSSPQHDEKSASPLTDEQIRKTLDIHFPVYAAGYNWLQSNMDSGVDLMQGVGSGDGRVMGINEIIQRYDGVRGQVCKQVIVVTHSMGGLVARAAALVHGGAGKMLGIVHGVQPIDGAAAFYKRIAAGFLGEGSGATGIVVGEVTAQVLGPSAEETIPELAYNPGPLELAPNRRYNGGKPWLFIKDNEGKVLKALPEHGDPYAEIYLDTQHVWRAVNPAWLNPSGVRARPLFDFGDAVKKASGYHAQLGGRLHPKTYAHWGDDTGEKSWGSMTWTASGGNWQSKWSIPGMGSVKRWRPDAAATASDPVDWTFSGSGNLGAIDRDVEGSQGRGIRMSVAGPVDAGDGTVPAAASGAQIANYAGCQVARALTGFDHQSDYDSDPVRNVLLDALVRLVEPVRVTD